MNVLNEGKLVIYIYKNHIYVEIDEDKVLCFNAENELVAIADDKMLAELKGARDKRYIKA